MIIIIIIIMKIKINFTPEQVTKPRGEERYSSTLSLTSELYGVSGHCHAPAALPPVKTR